MEKRPWVIKDKVTMTPTTDNVGKVVKVKTAEYGKYVFTLRSFHPNKYFKPLGMFFEGDHRGFSTKTDSDTKSRIWQRFLIDTRQKNDSFLISEGSSGIPGDGRRLGVNSDPSHHPLQKAKTDYRRPGTEPRARPFNPKMEVLSPQRRSFSINAGYVGENYAMPFALETKEAVFAIQKFRQSIVRLTLKEMGWPPYPEPTIKIEDAGAYVPSLDVYADLTVMIDTVNYFLDISIKVDGDAFPNQESFVTDQTGKSIFLGAFIRKGYPMTALRYPLQEEIHRPMYSSHIKIKIKTRWEY